MSDLVVTGFKDENAADQVLNKLAALQKEYMTTMRENAEIPERDSAVVRLRNGFGAAAGAVHAGYGVIATFRTPSR